MKNFFSNYSVPFLLGLLIFASNFLNTSLFNFGDRNFAVIVAVTLISIVIIIFFNEYFGTLELLTENLILFSLRNIILGAMGIFGMSIQEVLSRESEALILREKVKILEETAVDSKKESALLLKEANLKAEKIINDAVANSKNTMLLKERIEQELKEFIQTERELLKRYEELN
jgi:hypothetical protein